MPEKDQHWLYGPELLTALISAGVVPPMTSCVEIVVDNSNFVSVRAVIALSTEQLQAVVGVLAPPVKEPTADEVERARMRAVIDATKAKEPTG